MAERGAFEDAMDAAFANVRWMLVREEKSSKSSEDSFFFDAQGRRFKELHDIHAPVGLDFGGNWIPVISSSDSASEGWSPCSGPFNRSWERRWKRILKPSQSHQQSQPASTKLFGSGNASDTSKSWIGNGGRLDESSPVRLRHGSSPCYVESLYDDPARGRDADRSTSAGGSDGDGGSGNRNGNRKTASLSVTGMEQKLAELLLLSNTPDMDSGRIMAAAASLKRDADAVLQDSSLNLQQRAAFRKLRDGVDQLQQTIKNPRMQRAAAASSSSRVAAGKTQSLSTYKSVPLSAYTGSEEVDDDWTPRSQNFEQQQPLLQQQQLQLLRLQQEELDFEAGVAEDRRSNLSQISKDAAQVHELFQEVAQCVQQGGEQLKFIDQMVDDTHAATRQGAKDILNASKQTSSNIGIGAIAGGAIGAGFGSLLGPVGVAAIGSAAAVVGGAIAKGVNVLKGRMIDREAKKAGINLDED